jgi:Fe-S-cluster containining protein
MVCEHVPGCLSPADVERMAGFLEYTDVERFARENLLASEGARTVIGSGKVIHLPMLVPSIQENGHCRFLEEGRCTIHAASPYGCAFLDAHLSDRELAERTGLLQGDILRDFEASGIYSTTWRMLRDAGLAATPARVRRYDLAKALRREHLA